MKIVTLKILTIYSLFLGINMNFFFSNPTELSKIEKIKNDSNEKSKDHNENQEQSHENLKNWDANDIEFYKKISYKYIDDEFKGYDNSGNIYNNEEIKSFLKDPYNHMEYKIIDGKLNSVIYYNNKTIVIKRTIRYYNFGMIIDSLSKSLNLGSLFIEEFRKTLAKQINSSFLNGPDNDYKKIDLYNTIIIVLAFLQKCQEYKHLLIKSQEEFESFINK
jgi:hypothetical protein